MNIARKIHDLFRVKGDQKGAIASAISQASAATITQVVIAGAGGSTGNNNGGLNDEERLKFDSIEYGAQKNQDAFSNLDLNAVNFDVDGQLVSTSSVSISANTPTDKANVKIIGLDPLVVTLESEPLFNSTQVDCTGFYNSVYKIEYVDNNSKVKLTYVSGDQFLSADIDVVKVTHDDTVLAEYPIGEYSYTVAGDVITSFTIPYSTPNFALIRFYKYQQEDTELENGSIITNEVLQLLATIEASPTTLSVIKLSNPYQELWHYLEDEDGNQFLWTDCNVFSTKEVSAYGKRTGSGVAGGAGYLYELGDVSADAKDPANNSILLYNSTTKKWEVTDGSNIKTDLSSYATIAYTKLYVGDLIKVLKGDAPTTLDTLEELAAAISNDPNFGTTVTTNIDNLTDKVSDLNTKVELFLSWFVWDDANGAIKALHNLYGVSEIAAYGYGKEEEITIRTQLGDLSDVTIKGVEDGNILMYNAESGKWINVSKTSVGLNETELANYLVTNGYKTSAYTLTVDVNNVPVGKYNPYSENKTINITVPTHTSDLTNNTLVPNERKVSAGTGLAGGGTLNDDIELRLATFGTAGDYYKVTVDEYGRVSTGKTTLDIADITNLLSSLDSKLDVSEIEKWFTIIYDTNGDITSIQANYTFYSVGEISAYGLGDIGSSTRTTLSSMDDVDISSSLSKDDMLVYNGTKWVNIQMSQVQGVSTWDDLLGKPTTISGFGITDAYTKTEVDNKVNTINSNITSINSSISTITSDISNLSTSLSTVSTKLDTFLEGSDTDDIINKWKELEAFLAGYTQTQTLAELLEVKANSSVKISAGTGLTGGGDLTANRTISLATSGVTAGTYTKVTVDAYGRVTSGDTLLDTDIPSLDWSKITTGKPTTLEGYGITDGVNSITVTGDGNAITAVSISNHLLTFTKGETFLPQSTFDDLFEKINIGTDDNPIYVIKAKYNFYSIGEIAAYGFEDETKKTYTTLAELDDVLLSDAITTGSVLMYDGSKWYAGTVKSGLDELALEAYLKNNDYAQISNIPTKVSQLTNDSGYITSSAIPTALKNPYSLTFGSNVYDGSEAKTITASDLGALTSHLTIYALTIKSGDSTITTYTPNSSANSITFIEGSNISIISNSTNNSITINNTYSYTHPSNGANTTITNSDGRVLCAVVVDSLGHVTSVDSKTLSAADIPSLNWSKITSGKPTTLSGYGITDGVNSITISGDGNAITGASISDHVITFTKGATYLASSVFDDLFEKVNVGTSDSPVYAIKAKYNLYSVGEVAAYGFGDTGTVKGTLASLEDVNINTPTKGQALVYDGTNWTNLNIAGISVEGYVDITTDLTIGGIKTFTDTIKYQPTYYSYNAEDIEYRNTTGTLFGGIGAVHNGSAISYFYIGKGSTPWDSNNGLTIGDELGFKGYTVWHSGNAIIPTVPTKLSAFKDDVVAGKYLPLSGGTISGELKVTDKVTFLSEGKLKIWNVTSTRNSTYGPEMVFVQTSIDNADPETLWPDKNRNDLFLLPKGGHVYIGPIETAQSYTLYVAGTTYVTDYITAPSKGIIFYGSVGSTTGAYLVGSSNGVYLNGHTYVTLESSSTSYHPRVRLAGTDYPLLSTYNYNTYVPTKTGTGASGTWGISVSGNAASATKLQTARTIWGQSFDGTGNVSGDISGTNTIHFSGINNVSYGGYISKANRLGMDFYSNNAGLVMHLKDNGNVGIKNSNPEFPLDIAAGAVNNPIRVKTSNAESTIWYYNNSLNWISGINPSGHFAFYPSTKSVWCAWFSKNGGLQVSLSDTIDFTSSGVTIGNGDITARYITCYGKTDGYINLGYTNSAGNCGEIYFSYKGAASTSNILGFGFYGKSVLQILYSGQSTFSGNIVSTGEITAYLSSDIRLKTNLNKLNSLSILRKLGVYSFDWNEEALQLRVNKNTHDYGLIAQLVQLYIPEVINTNMFNKGYLGIDYLRLVPFTISAIKEVDDEVTKLKKRVKQLERKLLKYESTEVFFTKRND